MMFRKYVAFFLIRGMLLRGECLLLRAAIVVSAFADFRKYTRAENEEVKSREIDAIIFP